MDIFLETMNRIAIWSLLLTSVTCVHNRTPAKSMANHARQTMGQMRKPNTHASQSDGKPQDVFDGMVTGIRAVQQRVKGFTDFVGQARDAGKLFIEMAKQGDGLKGIFNPNGMAGGSSSEETTTAWTPPGDNMTSKPKTTTESEESEESENMTLVNGGSTRPGRLQSARSGRQVGPTGTSQRSNSRPTSRPTQYRQQTNLG